MNDENEGAFGGTAGREAVEQIELSESESVDSETTGDSKSVKKKLVGGGSSGGVGTGSGGGVGTSVSDTFPPPETLPGEDSDQGSGSDAES